MTSEAQTQRALALELPYLLPPRVWWCAIPNEGSAGNAVASARMKAQGRRAGAPDLMFVRDGRVFFVEMKSAKGRVSPVQRAAHSEIEAAGAPVAVCRSIDEVLTSLAGWGFDLRVSPSREKSGAKVFEHPAPCQSERSNSKDQHDESNNC